MKKLLPLLTLLLLASFSVTALIVVFMAKPGDFSTTGESVLFASVFIGILVYFIPAIIAFKRSHRNRWIILLLNFFGATIILWIIALVWSLNKIDDPIKGGQPVVGQPGDRVL